MIKIIFEEVMLDPAGYFKNPEELMQYPHFGCVAKA